MHYMNSKGHKSELRSKDAPKIFVSSKYALVKIEFAHREIHSSYVM